jgi:hypothetical protein
MWLRMIRAPICGETAGMSAARSVRDLYGVGAATAARAAFEDLGIPVS